MKTSHRRPGFRGSTAAITAITAHPFATDSPSAATANNFEPGLGEGS